MDSPHFPSSGGNKPSPKRELQGPRPPPLKVRKDSHKIAKKPPLVPQQHYYSDHHHLHPPQVLPQQQQYRPPVIIYTVSPKVIHTEVSDFMSTVQRLTGFSSSSSSSSASSSSSSSSHVCVSPAARFATIDKANNSSNNISSHDHQGDNARILMGSSSSTGTGSMEEMELELLQGASVERTGVFPSGILSPIPSALPPISPNFFCSPAPAATDPNSLGFLHDLSLSPIFHGHRSFIEGTMVPSPTALLNSSTPITSPTLSFDLFNHFLDL